MQQNTNEWLQLRKKYIGASDAPVIMGVNKKYPGQPKKTPFMLWKEKLNLETYTYSNSNTRFGHEMEPFAREMYENLIFRVVAPKVVFHKEIPFMMASLDGLTSYGDLAVEIKCANSEDHECAKNGNVPVHYVPQVQHQLACLGHDYMHYFSFHKGDGILLTVDRDDDYIDLLIEQESKFWKYVENEKEPPLTEDDYVEQSEEAATLAENIFFLQSKIKELEATVDSCKERLTEICNNTNSSCGDYLFTKYRRKGSINYSSIPILQNMDLDSYRKESSYYWKVTKKKDEL